MGTLAHGRILRQYFNDELERGKPIDQKLLLYILYNDLHQAAMFLVRPCFDPDWLSYVFRDLLDYISTSVPSLATASNRFIDLQVTDPIIRSVFICWTRIRIVLGLVASGAISKSMDISYWTRISVFVTQGRLVSHYLDTQQRIAEANRQSASSFASTSDRDQLVHLHASAYMALAALFLIRSSASPDILAEKPFFDALKLILDKLQFHLATSEALPMQEDNEQYSRARLWALFAGALAERQDAAITRHSFSSPSVSTAAQTTDAGRKQSDEVSRRWFFFIFSWKSLLLRLFMVCSVRDVFETFMYSEHIRPHASEWFAESLGALDDVDT